MHLHSPHSAILSAVIFTRFIIIVLIRWPCGAWPNKRWAPPRCCDETCSCMGSAGLVAPFAGLKLIDLLLVAPATDLDRKRRYLASTLTAISSRS